MYLFITQSQLLMALSNIHPENIVGKMLVTSMVSCSQNVFCVSKRQVSLSQPYQNLSLSPAKALNLDNSKIVSFVNSSPNDKILDMTKMKAFADDKISAAQMMISVLKRVENTMGKGKKCCLGVLKSRDCVVKS